MNKIVKKNNVLIGVSIVMLALLLIGLTYSLDGYEFVKKKSEVKVESKYDDTINLNVDGKFDLKGYANASEDALVKLIDNYDERIMYIDENSNIVATRVGKTSIKFSINEKEYYLLIKISE